MVSLLFNKKTLLLVLCLVALQSCSYILGVKLKDGSVVLYISPFQPKEGVGVVAGESTISGVFETKDSVSFQIRLCNKSAHRFAVVPPGSIAVGKDNKLNKWYYRIQKNGSVWSCGCESYVHFGRLRPSDYTIIAAGKDTTFISTTVYFKRAYDYTNPLSDGNNLDYGDYDVTLCYEDEDCYNIVALRNKLQSNTVRIRYVP